MPRYPVGTRFPTGPSGLWGWITRRGGSAAIIGSGCPRFLVRASAVLAERAWDCGGHPWDAGEPGGYKQLAGGYGHHRAPPGTMRSMVGVVGMVGDTPGFKV